MAKKKINEENVLSELSGSRFFQSGEPENDRAEAQQSANTPHDDLVDRDVDMAVDSEVNQEVDQSTDEQTGQPTNESTRHTGDTLRSEPNRSSTSKSPGHKTKRRGGGQFVHSPILSRPKSFYITKKQDADIDIIADCIAEKLEGKIAHKIDRSVVIRSILEAEDWTRDEAVEFLAKHIVNKLVSQLVD